MYGCMVNLPVCTVHKKKKKTCFTQCIYCWTLQYLYLNVFALLLFIDSHQQNCKLHL